MVSSGNRLTNWILDSGPPLEEAQLSASVIEKNICQLSKLLVQIESTHNTAVGAGDSEVK